MKNNKGITLIALIITIIILLILAVTGPHDMIFSTGSTEYSNSWYFSSNSNYNYNLNSGFTCSSDYSGNPNFITAKGNQLYDHNYASGRLTYNAVPSQTLTDLGSFTANYRDQEPEDKEIEGETFGSLPPSGSNYLINVKPYYGAMKKAQTYCSEESAFTNSDATLALANLVIEYSKKRFYIIKCRNFC